MISPSFDALVCDLDGVIYRGARAIPGAVEAIDRLRGRGIKILFCTNNSNSTIQQYMGKLQGLGLDVSEDEVLTSAKVTAGVLQARGFAGKTAIVVGGAGLREALGEVCISVKDDPQVTVADVVVVGFDLGFTYEAMRRAAVAVRRGAALVATNDDASFPAEEELWPGAGAILSSIETACGVRAEVMGKPHPPMMEAAARRLEGSRAIAVVGDRPDTDLAGGLARGWRTILVLSGVTTTAQAERLENVPDLVIGSIADLA